MRFSPFNPIRFFAGDDAASGNGYVRKFAESDWVMLEVFLEEGDDVPTVELTDAESGEKIDSLRMKVLAINSVERMAMLERTGFTPGHYHMKIGDWVSECVEVVEDRDIDGTVLIQYAYRDNRQRKDVMTHIFTGIRYFNLRVEGGFNDTGWVFGVDAEQYHTQSADTVELASYDRTDKMLTVGSSSGLDVGTAELINRILACPLVFIGATRYARVEGTSLERVEETDEHLAVYSVLLREARYLSAEMEMAIRLNLRRTPEQIRHAEQRPRRYS